MKFESFLYVTLCLLNWYADGKLVTRETVNEISTRRPHRYAPPHTELTAMARHTLHNADWASIGTVSAIPAIEGFPFSNVKSMADVNSTGIPYFYMSPLDITAKDLSKDSRATVLVSLKESGDYGSQQWGPEDPRSNRLMLIGIMKKVKEGTPEYRFAKDVLFERHPAMANFPADHDWFIAKLKIGQIAIVDYLGGAKYIPVKDYLAYDFTQTANTTRSQIEGLRDSFVINTINKPSAHVELNRNQNGRDVRIVYNTVNSARSYIKLNLRVCKQNYM